MSTDSRSEIRLPETLTHYYRKVSRPFRTLSELAAERAADVINELSRKEPLPRRLTTPDYLPRRRQIEQTMRDQFVSKGGRPDRHTPHYMILGTWSHWEQEDGFDSVAIPLSAFDPEVISFTYPDSWVSFAGVMLSGEPLPRFPYHGQVYRLDELEPLVAEHDLPGERWRIEENRRMETYIEAQIWNDAIIGEFIGD